ncbi:MAG: pyridoxal-phosphate dependent enzyme [Cyanobacteria bacterium]|nr:pyridoxal-phosphate dependent enzyme [Cyanobacteriota bacterium]
MRQIPLDAITDAARHVYKAAVRTPLIKLDLPFASAAPAPDLSAEARTAKVEVYLKLESLQPIGSFKIRGAWNAVRKLSPEQMKDGVWTVSAGNAAQGVAFAARLAGVPCSVMVMDTAPQIKLRAIEKLGATIIGVSHDECWTTVETHASPRMKGHFVHPFDDDDFIAGNATAGLEILEDLPDVDAVVAALGGGGLLSGIASVMRAKKPGVKVFAAEPETAAPLELSLRRNAPSYFDGWKPTFVDGAGGKSVLPTMWPLLKELVDGSIVMPLDDIASAMRKTAERVHVVAEGAAGTAIAAAISGRAGTGKVVAVVSGGNIDLSRFSELVRAHAAI